MLRTEAKASSRKRGNQHVHHHFALASHRSVASAKSYAVIRGLAVPDGTIHYVTWHAWATAARTKTLPITAINRSRDSSPLCLVDLFLCVCCGRGCSSYSTSMLRFALTVYTRFAVHAICPRVRVRYSAPYCVHSPDTDR